MERPCSWPAGPRATDGQRAAPGSRHRTAVGPRPCMSVCSFHPCAHRPAPCTHTHTGILRSTPAALSVSQLVWFSIGPCCPLLPPTRGCQLPPRLPCPQPLAAWSPAHGESQGGPGRVCVLCRAHGGRCPCTRGIWHVEVAPRLSLECPLRHLHLALCTQPCRLPGRVGILADVNVNKLYIYC